MTPAGFDVTARELLAFSADAAVRAVALAAVMGAAIVLLRKKRASVRLSAWTFVLYGALALPVLGLVLPDLSWRVPAVRAFDGWWPATMTSAAQVPTTQFSAAAATSAGAGPAASATSAVSGWDIAGGIYLAGVLALLVHAGAGWSATRRLRLSAQPVEDRDALMRLSRHSSEAGLGTPPRLVASPDLFVPVTMSIVRPIIALPADWRDWPAGKLDAVLIHEIAHVARRDALTQRLALFYRAVLWVSPLSWWLGRRLADLAEQASDEAALAAGIEPATYAETLLDFFALVQQATRRADWHVAMARRADADAAQRVERILSWKGGAIMTRSKLLMAIVVLAIVSATAVAASVRVTSEPVSSQVVPVSVVGKVAAPLAATLAASPMAPVPSKITRQKPMQQTPPPVPKPAATPTPAQTPAQTPSPTPDEEFMKGALSSETPGLLKPVPITMGKPKYTPDAMRNKLQGIVSVDIIINPDGTVARARVKDSLDKIYGLDEAAVDAAMKWTFTPGTLKGEAVAVHAVLMLEFRLH